ncbi:MAG: hypothetical protein ISS14_00560 [Actinobacteria bacterium]|nr:hypothetical protein [Actinomycetota bacterium]
MKKPIILLLISVFILSILFVGIGCKEEAAVEEAVEEVKEAVEEAVEEVKEAVEEEPYEIVVITKVEGIA